MLPSAEDCKVKLVTVVEGDPKAPFSIGVREGATPFPELLHFTLDLYLMILSVKQGDIKYHFLSLWYDSTWDWTPISRTIDEHSTHQVKVSIFEASLTKRLSIRLLN